MFCYFSQIFIGHLDPRITEAEILKITEKFGKVVHINYIWHLSGPKKGSPAGFCFVEFSKREEAEAAVSGLDGKKARGSAIKVRFAEAEHKELSEAESELGTSLGDRPPVSEKSFMDPGMPNVDEDVKQTLVGNYPSMEYKKKTSSPPPNDNAISLPFVFLFFIICLLFVYYLFINYIYVYQLSNKIIKSSYSTT